MNRRDLLKITIGGTVVAPSLVASTGVKAPTAIRRNTAHHVSSFTAKHSDLLDQLAPWMTLRLSLNGEEAERIIDSVTRCGDLVEVTFFPYLTTWKDFLATPPTQL